MNWTRYLLSGAALFSLMLIVEGYGTSCLISRLEYHPCTYRHPRTTNMPGINEYGDYETRFTQEGTCDIIRRRHRVKPISMLGTSCGSVFYLSSPNKLLVPPLSNYKNQKLAIYNVRCSPNQYIYFYMTDMNLENTTCHDQVVNSSKCVDYVEVRTPSGNVIASNCGTDTTNLDGQIFPYSSIQTIFRTNVQVQFPGFEGVAECFSPTMDNCSVETIRQQGRPTEKQDGATSTETCQESTHETITVPYGQDVLLQYSQQLTVLTFIARQTNHTVKILKKMPIQYLFVHSTETNRVVHYYPHIPKTFNGPGMLFMAKANKTVYACFQDSLVDISGFTPNQRETEMIYAINYGLQIMLPEDHQSEQTSKENEADVETSSAPPRYSRRSSENNRQEVPHKTDSIQDETFLRALTTETNNPILKVSISLLFDALNRENPARMLRLQREAAADAARHD